MKPEIEPNQPDFFESSVLIPVPILFGSSRSSSHILQGTTDCTGVYRKDRLEYPVIAIREIDV